MEHLSAYSGEPQPPRSSDFDDYVARQLDNLRSMPDAWDGPGSFGPDRKSVV